MVDRPASGKGRVVVAMSGGVDSSVAAALLLEEGYEVVGVTMKLFDYSDSGGARAERSCCDLRAFNDARRVCDRLEIPYYVLDLRESFRSEVLDDFVDEYMEGRTPNPCIRCNTRIKWEHLYRRAEVLEAGWIATGHYARIERLEDGSRALLRARNAEKDQSYALWGLRREQLPRTLFPLGSLSKPEVRRIARRLGLANAGRPESQDICFVPDGDYGAFLRRRAPSRLAAVPDGEIVDERGKVLGRHRGFPYYTVGQRRGLNLALGSPVYVTRIDAGRNRVSVAPEEGLQRRGLEASSVNWLVDPPRGGFRCRGAIRYRDPGASCTARWSDGVLSVEFDRPRRAITPGQSLVLYDGERLIGGGIIEGACDRLPAAAGAGTGGSR